MHDNKVANENRGQGQSQGAVKYYKKTSGARRTSIIRAPHFRMRKVDSHRFPTSGRTGSATCLTSGADRPPCSVSCQQTSTTTAST